MSTLSLVTIVLEPDKTADLVDVTLQGVALMIHPGDVYRGKLCDDGWRRIQAATDERIRLS